VERNESAGHEPPGAAAEVRASLPCGPLGAAVVEETAEDDLGRGVVDGAGPQNEVEEMPTFARVSSTAGTCKRQVPGAMRSIRMHGRYGIQGRQLGGPRTASAAIRSQGRSERPRQSRTGSAPGESRACGDGSRVKALQGGLRGMDENGRVPGPDEGPTCNC
jgi:hypothetical protein